MADDGDEEDFECPDCHSVLGLPTDVTEFDCPVCGIHVDFAEPEEVC